MTQIWARLDGGMLVHEKQQSRPTPRATIALSRFPTQLYHLHPALRPRVSAADDVDPTESTSRKSAQRDAS